MIKIIEPRVEYYLNWDYEELIKFLERSGRTCYKSEDRITPDSAEKFIKMIIKRKHESVLEHVNLSVLFIGSRAFSHQLVRHRIGVAYSQESMRFCNYNKNEELEVICPSSIKYHKEAFKTWKYMMETDYRCYRSMIEEGIKPEDARFVLPNGVKTEVFTTMNIRQWRHVFYDRALNPHAQWEIKELMQDVLKTFYKKYPVLFEDLYKELINE